MRAAEAIDINDLRTLARKRLPRMVFDYIDGGADDELTLRRSVDRFCDYEWVWDTLVDVSTVRTHTRVFGQPSAQPFLVSPTAASRLFHPMQGELATARAAEAAGVPYCVSTLASHTIEDIAKAAPTIPKIIQVYVWKDRGLVKDFLARARAAGYTGCVLTVDAVIAGHRERDPRNGFSIPPSVNLKTATQALARPGYLFDLARSPEIGPANFRGVDTGGRDVMGVINDLFDRTMTWKDAEWMAQEWGGPFAVKGISTPEDARKAVDSGASAVWLSNHGGRQIDTAVPVVDLVPDVRAAVPEKIEVIADGGVRRGSHVLKLIAQGATSVALGRACLYGLAAGGETGVTRALDILAADIARLLALLGVPDVKDLDERLLRLRR